MCREMRINSHFVLFLFLCAVGGFYPGTTAAQVQDTAAQDAQPNEVVAINEVIAEMNMAIVAQNLAAMNAVRARGVTMSSLAPDQAAMLFHRAVRQGSGAVVEALLDIGTDIEAADARGYTPLMLALEAANAEAAYTLKLRGASLAARANNGDTAEYLAGILGLGGFEKPVSSAAPAVDLANANAMLLLAAELGNTENMRFALAAGADPAARAENGWSAMLLAALGAHEEALGLIVEAFRAQGFDAALRDVRRSVAEVDVDPIEAALIGQGGAGKDHARVERVVRYLADTVYHGVWRNGRPDRYHRLASQLGYENFGLAALAFGLDADEAAAGVAPAKSLRLLPTLEYNLPIGLTAGRAGWSEVQSALREAGFDNLSLTGSPDEATLQALAAYLKPLAGLVEKRGMEARLRADEEETLNPRRKTEGVHYGDLVRRSNATHYTGEVYSEGEREAYPIGYVEEWSETSLKLAAYRAYHFHRGGTDVWDPLCRIVRGIDRKDNYYFRCRMLDGAVHLQQDDGDSLSVWVDGHDARLEIKG